MEPKIVKLPELKIVGIQTRTKNSLETSATTAKIPSLWEKFFKNNIDAAIPDRTNENEIMAVYTDYESDHKGDYTLLIGGQIEEIFLLPDSMGGVIIPEGKYLVFRAEGPMPDAVINAWHTIWQYFQQNRTHQRTYIADFERYNKTIPNVVEIYISIE